MAKNSKRAKELEQYSITLDDYSKMATEQDGRCAICLNYERCRSTRGKIFSLSVDHNHKTKKVRGLLCRDCNLMVGLLEQFRNIEECKKNCDRLIQYLIKHDGF